MPPQFVLGTQILQCELDHSFVALTISGINQHPFRSNQVALASKQEISSSAVIGLHHGFSRGWSCETRHGIGSDSSSFDGVSGHRDRSGDDSDDDIERCLPNGDALVFVDGLCEDGSIGRRGWDTESDSDDGEEGHPERDGFLAPICVTYDVKEDAVPNTNCGGINSIFLWWQSNQAVARIT